MYSKSIVRSIKGKKGKIKMAFYKNYVVNKIFSILFYSILFYSILFYSILFYKSMHKVQDIQWKSCPNAYKQTVSMSLSHVITLSVPAYHFTQCKL